MGIMCRSICVASYQLGFRGAENRSIHKSSPTHLPCERSLGLGVQLDVCNTMLVRCGVSIRSHFVHVVCDGVEVLRLGVLLHVVV
jgi:hypothetical protein